MLEHLKMKLGLVEASSAEANSEQVTELNTQLSELSTKFAEAESVNLALTEQVAQLASQLSEAQAKVAELSSKLEADVATAAQAKLDARKAKLESTVGTVKAEEVFTALSSLDDTQFNAVVSAMETNLQAEADSPTFKEQGVEAAASDEAVENKPTHFNKNLRK